MTGFGKAQKEFEGKTITAEIRSLNSKQIDLSLRMPNSFREKELELRADITKQLERGKIDLSLHIDYRTEQSNTQINISLAKAYHSQLKQLASELNEAESMLLEQVLKMPEVLKNERKEFDENEWKQAKEVIQLAIDAMQNFRATEGQTLENEFQLGIKTIGENLEQIKLIDKTRIETVKNRIKGNLNELIPADKIDNNRFEQELIYFLEKFDITEEKVRLKTHLDYFIETMKEPACGRKLNFISQEIGREINTIGSKANDAAIQKFVVQMKDELEKIKEQSMNIL